jgi:hypothetical protein
MLLKKQLKGNSIRSEIFVGIDEYLFFFKFNFYLAADRPSELENSGMDYHYSPHIAMWG